MGCQCLEYPSTSLQMGNPQKDDQLILPQGDFAQNTIIGVHMHASSSQHIFGTEPVFDS